MSRRDIILLKNKRGVTLLENIIAVLVTGLVFGGFLQICHVSALMLTSAHFRMAAVNIAQAEIEDLKAIDFDNISVSTFTPYRSTSVILDDGPTSSADDDIIGEMRTAVRDTVNNPTNGKKVAVEVLWTAFGQSKQEIVETVIYADD